MPSGRPSVREARSTLFLGLPLRRRVCGVQDRRCQIRGDRSGIYASDRTIFSAIPGWRQRLAPLCRRGGKCCMGSADSAARNGGGSTVNREFQRSGGECYITRGGCAAHMIVIQPDSANCRLAAVDWRSASEIVHAPGAGCRRRRRTSDCTGRRAAEIVRLISR